MGLEGVREKGFLYGSTPIGQMEDISFRPGLEMRAPSACEQTATHKGRHAEQRPCVRPGRPQAKETDKKQPNDPLAAPKGGVGCSRLTPK